MLGQLFFPGEKKMLKPIFIHFSQENKCLQLETHEKHTVLGIFKRVGH